VKDKGHHWKARSEGSSWSLKRMWYQRALDAARPAMGEVARATDTRGDYERESKI
jgi:hypothetical protein